MSLARRLSSSAVLTLAALSFGAAPAAAQEAPPIIGGRSTSDFVPVGALVAYHERYGDLQAFCSGTLVDSTWVVTAAHCVEDGIGEFARYGYDIYFLVGTEVYDDAGWTAYAPVIYSAAHPDYDLPYNDAGILQLGDGGITTVGTIPMNTDRVTADWVGEDMTYVGFGISSDAGSGSGTKRTVDVPVYDYDSGLIITWDEAGGANICSGDSGGAALMPADGGWELVGINSFGFMMDGSSRVLCDDPDAAAGVTRVDAVIDWINEEMGLSGGDGGASGGGTDPGTGDGATDGGDPGADGSADGAADGAGDAGAGGGDTGVDAEQAADVTLGDATASVPEGDASDSKGVGCAAGGASAPGLGWVAAGALGLALRRRRAAR
ncbi:MAG: hypothetical protein RL071_1848 [Pseudomonadota bacterium]